MSVYNKFQFNSTIRVNCSDEPTVGHQRYLGLMAQPRGLSTPRAPKDLCTRLVAKLAFWARICTIFCMRGATYISDGFRMRAGSLGP